MRRVCPGTTAIFCKGKPSERVGRKDMGANVGTLPLIGSGLCIDDASPSARISTSQKIFRRMK